MKFTLLILIFVTSCVIVDSRTKRINRKKGLHTSRRITPKPKNKKNIADEISSIVDQERSIIDKQLLANHDHDLTLNKEPVTNNRNIIYNDRPIVNHIHQYDIPLPLHDLPLPLHDPPGVYGGGNMYLQDSNPYYDPYYAQHELQEHIHRDDLNHVVHVIHVGDKLANIGRQDYHGLPEQNLHRLYDYPYVYHHYGDGLIDNDQRDQIHYVYDDELQDRGRHGLYDNTRVYHQYADPLLNDVHHDLYDRVYHYSNDELNAHDPHGEEQVYHYYYDDAQDRYGPHEYSYVYADGYGQPVYSVVHDKV